MVDREANSQIPGLRLLRGWPAFLDRMVSFAVLPGDGEEEARTKRLFTGAMWVSIVTSAVSAVQYYRFGAPIFGLVTTAPIIAAVVALVAMWVRPTTYPGVMHIVALGTMSTSVAGIIMFGGLIESANASTWGVLSLVGAIAVFADRRAHYWLAVFVVSTGVAVFVSNRVEPLYTLQGRENLALFNLVIITTFVYVVIYYFVRKADSLFRQSEGLLRNILPDEIADRLKVSDSMIADYFDSVSILFADVAGFTPMASRLEPEEIIGMLNSIFTAFDEMVEGQGLEKIKTIGDAYMVAAGVPVPRGDHATAICRLALEMQSHIAGHTYPGGPVEMRIGIASGPVVAGIIGRKKFSYDLWGDTVNLASRMESTGAPGRIQVTEATRRLVVDRFALEERGHVDVKGFGSIETWYLVGEQPGN